MVQKLDAILKSWGGLAPGQSVRLVNDKKPEPLQLLFKTRKRGRYEWSYEKEGPADWIVTIRKR